MTDDRWSLQSSLNGQYNWPYIYIYIYIYRYRYIYIDIDR